MKYVLLMFCAVAVVLAIEPRWTYSFNGPGNGWDQAWAVECLSDGNVLVCGDGQLNNIPFTFDMTVVRLTDSGSQRWVYQYNGPGAFIDQAYDLAVRPDGNSYVAGSSWTLATANDFTVLGVSDSGSHLWAYRIADSGISIARAVAVDRAGNAIACGTTGGYAQFTAISLDRAGGERWVYEYGALPGEAMAIALDSGGRSFCAGYLTTSDTTSNYEVVGLDTTGNQIFAIGITGIGRDTAVAVAVGPDGWVYSTGHVNTPTGPDIVVMGINPDTPAVSWTRYFDIGGSADIARGIACAADGSIYVSGTSWLTDSAGMAFVVLGLNRDGSQRWAHLDTGGRAAAPNIAGGLATDPDGNVYACGMLAGTAQTHMDAAVISLTSAGAVRWRYTYARPDTGMDMLGSITRGSSGALYACGLTDDPPNSDWLVVSLDPAPAVAEPAAAQHREAAVVPTLFWDEIRLSGAEPEATALFDAAGRVVARGELRGPRLAALPPGVYVLVSGAQRTRLAKVR